MENTYLGLSSLPKGKIHQKYRVRDQSIISAVAVATGHSDFVSPRIEVLSFVLWGGLYGRWLREGDLEPKQGTALPLSKKLVLVKQGTCVIWMAGKNV